MSRTGLRSFAAARGAKMACNRYSNNNRGGPGMDNLRFRWLHTLWIWLAAAVHIASAFWAPPVLGQSFPQKPLRMIVPFAPAGPPDILGRVISQKMAEGLGQPVIVANRVGAGGTIGSQAVAKAPPDGDT